MTGFPGCGAFSTAADFEELARRLGAPFLETERINATETIAWIAGKAPGVGVSINWRTVIRREVIDCFKLGIINAHAGDLPRFRGNATLNWAILSGANDIALTLHLMSIELDSGPVLLKKHFAISEETCFKELRDRLGAAVPGMFVEVVNGLADGSLKPSPQPRDPSLALRCYPRLPRDSEIDWSLPAERIAQLVRASSEPLPGAYTFLGTQRLTVWKARAEQSPTPFMGAPGQVAEIRRDRGEAGVLTGDGMLVLEEVELEGSARAMAPAVITSARMRLGQDISGEVARLAAKVGELENKIEGMQKKRGPFE